MNEDRLRALLRETRIPGADDAERRGLPVVSAAFAARKPPRKPVRPRLAIALAAGTLLAALLLTPAGAEVRNWIGDVLTVGVRDAEPALTEVPGGGRLLVTSPEGSWVVQPDGSRRLIGSYEEATWSPRGLFVGATSGHTLSAVEPDGTVHWSLSARASVDDPRWSPSGVRIAYRAGQALRVVVANGTDDRLIDPRAASVPAAWFPQGLHLIAYVDEGGSLRVLDSDTGKAMGSAVAATGTTGLSWAPNGSALLETTPRALWLRKVTVRKLADSLELGPAHQIPLPRGVEIRAATFSPRAGAIAALLQLSRQTGPPRSELVLIDPAGGSSRPLFTAPGHLSDLAWSPDGRRLLIPWPDADQWLFIPASGKGRVRAIGGVSTEFAPGMHGNASFPRVEGWCCPASAESVR